MYRYSLLIRSLLVLSHCIKDIEVKYTGKQLCINNTNVVYPQCYCDELCAAYGDCCFDGQIKRNSSSVTEGDSIDTFCMKLHHRPRFTYLSSFGAYVVRKCRNSSVDCEVDPDSFASKFPVSDEAGIAYLNAKCAECNGVNDFKYWQLSSTQLEATGISTDSINNTMNDLVNEILSSPSVERFFQYPGDRVPRFCIMTEPGVDICQSYQSINVCKHVKKLYKNKECCIASGDCPTDECEGLEFSRRISYHMWTKNSTTNRNLGIKNLMVLLLSMEEPEDSADAAGKRLDKKIPSQRFLNTQYKLLTIIHTDGSTQSVERFAACLYAITLYWEKTRYELVANSFIGRYNAFTYLYIHNPMGCVRKKDGCSSVVMAATIVSKAFVTIQDKAEISRLVRQVDFIFDDDGGGKLRGNSSIMTNVAWRNMLSAETQFDTSRESEGTLTDKEKSVYRSIFSMSPESVACPELTFVFSRKIRVSCTKPTENGGFSNLNSFLYVNVVVGVVKWMIF